MLQIEKNVSRLAEKRIEKDGYLKVYEPALKRRLANIIEKENLLTHGMGTLSDFANGHHFFGLHKKEDTWIFREWAPNASFVYLIGDFSGWQKNETFSLNRINKNGVWEIILPEDTMKHGDLYKLIVCWDGGEGERIPSYANRVVQDSNTHIFTAQVWRPSPYHWEHTKKIASPDTLLIYEAHIGMAQEEEKVGTYHEFTENVLPRIVKSGYNALQIMAIPEHPYYGSFGYHVSNFFAVSSRFGTPEELKALIDKAHEYGLLVIMDIVHSHAVNNETEGISRFDGTLYQYFHDGDRGRHIAWDSRCFDYNKNQVLHFLLSNCKYFMEEYRFDGFRFDGVTSMMYLHHGLERAFTSYDDYFDHFVDEDALTYLCLANKLIHEINPHALTIAEDISGMPGLALPSCDGGIGFDYRLAMGIPDLWIKIIKEIKDEDWPMGHLWYELTNRRDHEKSISYCESHDQALVGDKTLFFRLVDAEIYGHMMVNDTSLPIDRGMALHKMIRLITLGTAGNGYMNFMGNEFGHPEWIDFPREGNHWSYYYARRQWHLADDPELKYKYLQAFDQAMIGLCRECSLFSEKWPYLLHEHGDDNVLCFERKGLIFVFNFHPSKSYVDYFIRAPRGKYQLVLSSDHPDFGGHGRLENDEVHFTISHKRNDVNEYVLSLYLPSRAAFVLKRL